MNEPSHNVPGGHASSDLRKWQTHISLKLGGIAEATQRTILFSEKITALDALSAARVLRHVLVENFIRRDAPARITAEAAVMSLLEERWDPDHRKESLLGAVKYGDRLVSIFLGHVGPGNPEDEERFEVPTYSADRPLTLGERRSLATTPSKRNIALALRDPHPMVVEKLLENPKLTEKDVVFLSSRRPAPWAVLAKVAVHPRFRNRRSVARALVQNPYLPVSYALSLLTCQDKPTIDTLAKDYSIHPLLKETAGQILLALR